MPPAVDDDDDDRNADVVVLFGGEGSERRVSVASAQNVSSVLEDASLWFWRPDGSVLPVARGELLSFERPFEIDFSPASRSSWRSLVEALDSGESAGATFFLALHGGSGEDGTVQALFEARGRPFTGSSAAASRVAFDKALSRKRVAARGIQVADAVVVTKDAATHEELGSLFERHDQLVLKPVADGSSHGVRFVTSERELGAAIEHVTRSGVRYLAEAFVEGRELTVGVIESDGALLALPCSEVVLEPGRSFDYDGKYLGKGVREVTPAEVSEKVSSAAQSVALAAHQSIGCEGYSRTDVIMTNEEPVFLEINTLPGLTRASFIPQQLLAANVELREFLERQIEIGRARTQKR
jgi:D-alanine-D-alanine ligase